ncbi:hypothetical protein ABZ135_00295 [Streptomyces sp. NPDC006339]|uniref:hypothetical protein n=1 Tax=Streptomyces sp. NPDC006339 TaxID=3156755 RepID=UPI00339F8A2C
MTAAPWGTKPSGTTWHDEIAGCQDTAVPEDPTGPLRTRDRQRTADHPGMSERPSPDHRVSTAPGPATPGSAAPHAARSSNAHSLTALQVFRC